MFLVIKTLKFKIQFSFKNLFIKNDFCDFLNVSQIPVMY
uniref:Uncharacterized protein n=1 Tax=Anguilla anguilla TaxID=7936 RepID=A0A0E9XVX1_ANGAN